MSINKDQSVQERIGMQDEDLWHLYIDEHGVFVACPYYERWYGHAPKINEAPFEALMWFLSTQRQPPAELVAFLSQRWRSYLSGRMEFEAALLGPRKRRAGGYGQQHRALRRKVALAGEFVALLRAGLTRKAAAAEMVKRHRLQSAEAFLKWMGVIGRKKRKSS